MKRIKLIFLSVFFFFFINAYSQNDVVWGGGDGSLGIGSNWTGGNVPSQNDTLVFNSGNTVKVSIPYDLQYAGLRIEENTQVFLESSMQVSITFDVVKIRNGSSLNITQANNEIDVYCENGFIDGQIVLDTWTHEFEPSSSASKILFRNGSEFVAMPALSGYPFDNQFDNTVIFEDGASYRHLGGESPFGGPNINVTTFEPGSNYYIEDGNGSNIFFSGKTYGNIINNSGNNINVSSTNSGQEVFVFYNMINLNGSLRFQGNQDDEIVVLGDTIAASGGQIDLTFGSQGIHFDNDTTTITGPSDVNFQINGGGTNTSFTVLDQGNRLNIETSVRFSSSSSSVHNVYADGIIDTKENTVQANNVYIFLGNTAKLITAHPDGFQGCLPGADFFTKTVFEFNGNDIQNTGFTNGNIHPNKIIANNTSGIKMDTNLDVDTLVFQTGDFYIDNNRLTILGFVDYPGGGTLSGNLSNSVLKINDPATGDILINTPLQLDSLILNDSNGNTKLFGGDLLDVNNVYIENGNLYLQDCELAVEKSFYRNTLNGLLTGGTNASLTFNNLTNTPSSLNTADFHTFTNMYDGIVNLDGDLTIHNLLDLQDGTLYINTNTLTLEGDYSSGGGALAGYSNSNLIISGSGGTDDEMFLNFDINNNSLNMLQIDRAANFTVIEETPLNILWQLNLFNGKLKLSDNLTMPASATIDNDNSNDNYIITDEWAFLVKNFNAGTAVSLPMGTENYYAPLSINPAEDGDFSINVQDTVYSEGDYGTPFLNNNVNIRWSIIGGSNYDLSLSWTSEAQNAGFDNNNSYISLFDGSSWDNPGTSVSSTVNGLQTQNRTGIANDGIFAVFSGNNTPPTAANSEIVMLKNSVYAFIPDEFKYTDNEGDPFSKIEVTQIPAKGQLFLDINDDDFADAGELIASGYQISVVDILNGLLKYVPVADEFGMNYTDFSYRVSDGYQYSTGDYLMTINVSNNQTPVADTEQIFTIPEHSPQGTVVGKINASDPDGDNIYFYPLEGVVYSDAFKLADDGTIAVNNASLLEYSLNPSFEYDIDVCDDGYPELCTSVKVIINLEEIIKELLPANFISPNGDGHNDRWFVQGLENDTYEAFIFNNNGKLLFYSPDYHNGWDGTSRGRELPPGVYYYLLKSPNTELKGTVTLVR